MSRNWTEEELATLLRQRATRSPTPGRPDTSTAAGTTVRGQTAWAAESPTSGHVAPDGAGTVAPSFSEQAAWPRGIRQKPEDRLSCEVAAWLRLMRAENRLRCVWTKVANEVPVGAGQVRGILATMQKLRAMGANPGAPDFWLVSKRQALLIELKQPSPGRAMKRVNGELRSRKVRAGQLSTAQREYRDWCREVGAEHAVVTTLAEFQALIEARGWVR